MTTVLLIRHGQSVTNVTQVFTGHYDVPLSPLGQEQARRTAAYLQKNFRIDAIYASDLMRAMQTAQPTAAAVGLLGGVEPSKIQRALGNFHNTGMRQKIYQKDGFTIIEDCYNAGPESTEAALDILAGFRARAKGRCIAVLGDMLELGNRSAAEHYRIGRIAAAKVDMLYTYGTNSERMVSGAITGGMKQKFVEHFDTHEDLAHMLKMRARPGDVILFKGSRGMRMEKALSLFLKEEKS